MEMLQQQMALQKEAEQEERVYESEEKQKDRQTDVAIATIRAMGYSNESDVNQDQIPDLLQISKFNQDLAKFQENMLLQRERLSFERQKQSETAQLKREDIRSREKMKEKDLEIARENKTTAVPCQRPFWPL